MKCDKHESYMKQKQLWVDMVRSDHELVDATELEFNATPLAS